MVLAREMPLSGVLVVSLEQAVAAPFATRQLADLGARVIKIERPGRGDFARDYDSAAGDGLSSWFVWLNRSKESVVLDLKTGPGRQALDALIDRADVFVCNLAPAAIGRLGLEAGQLCARYPQLVACQLSGYGDDGPYAGRKAYDLLVQAEAGVLAVTGSPGEPAKAGISIADIAGGMYAYSGILAALLQRERTGRGGVVRTSLLRALAEWMSHPLLATSLTGSPPGRTGARHAAIVPYGPYLSSEGEEILLAVQNEAEWVRLCRDVLDLPGLATDSRYAGNERRLAARDEVEAALAPAVARLSTAELLRRLAEVGRTERCIGREFGEYFNRTAMPTVRVPDFNMSSVSQAAAGPGAHQVRASTEASPALPGWWSPTSTPAALRRSPTRSPRPAARPWR